MEGSVVIMVDLLFREAGQLIAPNPELWLRVVNPELWDAIKAFNANITGARMFWRSQPFLIERAVQDISRLCFATWKLTGRPFLDEHEKDTPLAETIKQSVHKQFERRFKEIGTEDITARDEA